MLRARPDKTLAIVQTAALETLQALAVVRASHYRPVISGCRRPAARIVQSGQAVAAVISSLGWGPNDCCGLSHREAGLLVDC
jgi:hypothetical protein